ncbi:uncharacterized protein K460DRAFT_269497 [Cucurbitaria berberidis CBS 394.84]|uniref:Mid2 domain-containing protein n=1 Tax=Cucurbitaria berberidis CBS 394.84 TaxID=1168544 RepID=A0A9P4GUB0_9PLEO|nr:uncharacterized protein K460DRAFT_269497 [Cucurbitaria berberidis CBS 394.84]KAF1851485.1 hypothetical protein K460DRAFT_269497 [Cucurbitaria berberidis CBS 394.84]
MTGTTLTWLRAAAVVLLAAQYAAAQTCCWFSLWLTFADYPNGKEAPSTEKPCSSAQGSACCPDNWECLDNGLCHYPANNLFGRYSCTDKDWNSPGCASNMCTYDMTAGGGESITQCSSHNNDWCCNADAQHVNCCKESPAPRPFFALQDGKPYATIGSNQASSVPTVSSITGLAAGTGSGKPASGTSASRTSASASSNAPSSANIQAASTSTTSAMPFTSIGTSLASDSAGVKTVYFTSIVTPTSAPTAAANANSSNSGGGSNSKIGVIVGCAVGIPLALALVGILIWMLRKRRQQKASPYKETSEMDADNPNSPSFAGGAAAKLGKKETFRHSRHGTTEIDGQPVGPGRPISTVKGHAELPSGSGFQPGQGTPYAPDTVGLGGGHGNERSTWGSVPPQYSPASNQTGFHQHADATELADTSIMPVINEKTEGEPQYIAYRPPQSQQPMAELPTVKTPPEDLEKQIHR